MEDSAIIDMQYKSSVLDWSRLINNPPVFIFIMLQSGRGLGEDERGTDAEYWSQFGNILRLLRARALFVSSHTHTSQNARGGEKPNLTSGQAMLL